MSERNQKTVLVIDDDEIDRQRMQRLLARWYEVREAELGDEGLVRFLQQRPDCVLLDYMLPDVNGLDLLDELVGHDAAVVMLTGQGNEQTAVESMKHGAEDYLVKDSIDAESLNRAISNAVDKASMRHKIREQRDELKRHRDHLEELVEERTVALKRSNEELEQFAYIASHDLKEPLRMVGSYTQLLAEEYEGRLDEEADKYIHYATDGAKRMQGLIDALLEYSRVGRSDAPQDTVDLQETVELVLANLKVARREAKAHIKVGSLPTVRGSGIEMMQLFQNLISNALKFRGEDNPVIAVSCQAQGENWEITIEDNGIGIEPEYRERIFQVFQRLHTRDEYPGTGIGLSICKKIVEHHGGRIWIESQPREGTTFHFTLCKEHLPQVQQKESLLV